MPNTRKAFPMDALLSDFKKAGFAPQSLVAIRQMFARTDVSLTDLGEVRNVVPIQGRTEGLSTTAANLNPDGTFNSTDNVHDGISTLRTYQQSGALSIIDNAGFEAALVNGSIPGWQLATAASMSLDTANPQAGKNSLKVVLAVGVTAATSVRITFARPNDTFRVSGWVRSDGVSQPVIQLTFLDKDGAFAGSAGTPGTKSTFWTFVQASLQAPANTSAVIVWLTSVTPGTAWFDSLQAARTLTSFEVTPINTAGTPRAITGLLTQHSAGGTQIDAASSTWQYGDGTVAYNSGSTDPGVLQTSYVTADDPAFGGGAIPYIPRTTPADANAANGRLFFGKIITAAGTATSTGGGTGGGGPISKSALA